MLRTHYDNLKVTRDAPIEVIEAAYAALYAKYNPDRNPYNAMVPGITRIIQRSYDVLSDPAKRAEHDRWIAEKESSPAPASAAYRPPAFVEGKKLPEWIMWTGAGTVVIVLCLIITAIFHPAPPESNVGKAATPAAGSDRSFADTPANPGTNAPAPVNSPKHLYSVPAQEPPAPTYTLVPRNEPYRRPGLAPNGNPWPAASGYIGGWTKTDGHSTATVDNTQNSSDMKVELCAVHVKLCSRAAFRTFLVRANDQFTLKNLQAGEYDFRYQDLASGAMSKSEPFTLTESAEDIPLSEDVIRHRTRSTTYSLTLYKVINGNTDSVPIGPDEF